jgi:hypothetical protein
VAGGRLVTCIILVVANLSKPYSQQKTHLRNNSITANHRCVRQGVN